MINIKKMARTQNSEFINNVNEYHRFWESYCLENIQCRLEKFSGRDGCHLEKMIFFKMTCYVLHYSK